MSAPKVGVWKLSHSTSWWWQCGAGPACPAKYLFGSERTLSAAADAGRVHLAQFHTAQMPVSIYCGTHGTHSAECGCGSGKSPAGDLGGRENAAHDIAHCDHSAALHDLYATAHNQAREDC